MRGTRGKVLWVEDERATIAGTLKGVERAGFEAVVVTNSQDASEEMRRQSFDAMIVDYQIPASADNVTKIGEGLTLVERVRSGEFGPRNADLPIMLLTVQTAALRRLGIPLSIADRLRVQPKLGSHRAVIGWLLDVAGQFA